jgi:hypothetical protein
MAVGFPTKTTYANGDVFSASDINDTNGTINLLTSSTISVAAGKNGIINGGFDVWQRGTSVSVAASSNAYTADRWGEGGGANATTVSRQATSDTTNLASIQYCARVQRNAAQTSTNGITFVQSMESVNSIPYAGKTVTMSFYARKGTNYSAASNALTAYIITGTGTDQNRIGGAYTGDNASIVTTVTLTATWQRFTLTGTLPTTATEIAAYFTYTPSGTAGAADYFEITGVQLELGSTPTTFSRAGGTIQGELAACQRYYYQTSIGLYVVGLFGGYNTTGNTIGTTTPHPVKMRIAPTGTKLGTFATSNTNQPSFAQVLDDAYILWANITSTGSGSFYSNSSGYLTFSAEL